MKKIITATAISAGLALGLAAPVSAAEVPCGTPAVDAVYKTVVTPGKPAVTHTDRILVSAAVPEVPGTPERTITHPAVTHTEKVFYVLRGWDKEENPTTSSPGWKKNNGQHKGHPDPGPNTPYTTGNDDEENPKSRNWFYYKLDTVVDKPAYTEVIPAVPGTPGKDAVYQDVTVVIEPAVPQKTERVLVSTATPAGPKCPEKPVVDNPQTSTSKRVARVATVSAVEEKPAELAVTGSENLPLGILGASLLGFGVILGALRKKFN